MKLLGKNNDLRTERGTITKTGYLVLLISSVFGICVFLLGRKLYGKAQKKKYSEQEKGENP